MALTTGIIIGAIIKSMISKYGDKILDHAIDFFSEKGKQFLIEKGAR